MLYFYALPDGNLFENPEILPLDVLSSRHGSTPFRFAFCPEEETLHIQDESFRKRMASGEKEAWALLNQALSFLESKHGARFLKRAFGDPSSSSTWRKLSQYARAWEDIKSFAQEELGSEPKDIDVLEYVPNKEKPLDIVGFDTSGQFVGKPALFINRYAHKAWKEIGEVKEDVDYDFLNDMLYSFCMTNSSILGLPKKSPNEEFFACRVQDKPRIFKNPKGSNEDSIRDKLSLPMTEVIVFFSFDPKVGRVTLHNMPHSFLGKRDKDLLAEIETKTARSTGASQGDLTLAFDPTLRRPFLSKLSRWRALWGILGGTGKDLPVLETTLDTNPLGPEAATLISSPEEEEQKVPGMGRFRMIRGLQVEYPFIAVCNRKGRGLAMRDILKTVCPEKRDPLDLLLGIKFLRESRKDTTRTRIKELAEYLEGMGLSQSDTLDFLAGPNLLKRAEIRRIVKERPQEKTASKKADLGPGLGINDWWHIGLQEGLNESQHTQNKPKKDSPIPFNLKQQRSKAQTYEVLLQEKRDKNRNYLKPAEQLLRESRI